jgi:hypothetical protein
MPAMSHAGIGRSVGLQRYGYDWEWVRAGRTEMVGEDATD